MGKWKHVGAQLLVVDTLPQFARLDGDAENNSGDALAAMAPLQRAAAEGLAVVVVRHERKSGGQVGDSGRGSSAFAGAVDTVLSLRRPEGNHSKNLRLLEGISRLDGVPGELVIELTSEGYVAHGTRADVAAQEARAAILRAAPRSEEKALTLEKLLDGRKVKRSTAQRVVKELIATGRLAKTGTGKKGNPFRYWAPETDFAQT